MDHVDVDVLADRRVGESQQGEDYVTGQIVPEEPAVAAQPCGDDVARAEGNEIPGRAQSDIKGQPALRDGGPATIPGCLRRLPCKRNPQSLRQR